MGDSSGWSTCGYGELPEWLKMDCNPFFVSLQRPPLPSLKACVKSVVRIHSETAYIWTHLIAFVIFSINGICFYFDKNDFPFKDKLVIVSLYASYSLAWLLSAVYHTTMCHSSQVNKWAKRMDYLGINICITATGLGSGYFLFYNEDQFII